MTPAEFIDDPNWADFLPEMDRAPRVRALPTHEDCSRIDCESAAMHLRRGGTLGRMDGYEERPGQIDMLSAIVRSYPNTFAVMSNVNEVMGNFKKIDREGRVEVDLLDHGDQATV